jgi:hypothetical protein
MHYLTAEATKGWCQVTQHNTYLHYLEHSIEFFALLHNGEKEGKQGVLGPILEDLAQLTYFKPRNKQLV